jgi:S-formylglutathione hydrolase FrmB
MTRGFAVLAVTMLVACAAPAGTPHGRPGFPAGGPPAPRADRGVVHMVSIPAPRSGFAARRTVVYVPAAARHPGQRLPVVMLLGGNPSRPQDWTDRWHIASFVDHFAAAHGGRAPIVVMPDENGTYRGDTECVDSRRGEAERYLTEDVPNYVRAHYRVGTAPWGIAGVSEGGMCATVLALRHPSLFGAFINMSGLARPSIGEHDRAATTTEALFDGSHTTFEKHDAVWLLGAHRYGRLAGWLGAGRADAAVLQAQSAIAAAAQRSGVPITRDVLPGAHGLGLWLRMLPAAFQWLWERLT